MIEGQVEVASATLEHCQAVYTALQEKATEEEILDESTDEIVTVGVWDGHMTHVFRELGLPAPYYTKVLKHLRRMRCIEQVRRGGGTATSKWYLWREPTMELFVSSVDLEKRTNPSGRLDAVEQQIRDLTRMMTAITTQLGVKL